MLVRKSGMFVPLIVAALVAGACSSERKGTAGDQSPATGFTTIDEGVLTIGTNAPYPPFEFRQGGKFTGFDIDLITEIAKRLGLRAEIVDTSFDTIFTQLAARQFDVVISSAFITPDREKEVNFTDPYFRAQGALTVNAESGAAIDGLDDLGEGDVAAVQEGGVWQQWAKDNLETKGVEVRRFPSVADAYAALEGGQAHAVIDDEPSAVAQIIERPDLRVVATIEIGKFYGIAVDPSNQPLLEEINRLLAEITGDGTYDRIYDSYPGLGAGGRITTGGG